MKTDEVKALELKEKLGIVALYIARLPSRTEEYRKAYPDYLTILAVVYQQKYNTLKHDKDTFDYFFDNGRKGWENESVQKINPDLYKIYKKYSNYSIEELAGISKMIVEEAKSYISFPEID